MTVNVRLRQFSPWDRMDLTSVINITMMPHVIFPKDNLISTWPRCEKRQGAHQIGGRSVIETGPTAYT